MTVTEFQNKLDFAITETNNHLPAIIDGKSLNAISFMKNRFIQEGTRADESGNEVAFPPYSDGYKKFKDKKSAGTPNRLVLTGAMLRSLKIVDRKQSGTVYASVIGGGDSLSEEKLEWNTERYGAILSLTTNEIDILTELTEEEIVQIFKTALG